MDPRKLGDRLPYRTTPANTGKGGRATLRVAMYVLVGLVLVAPVVQFEYVASKVGASADDGAKSKDFIGAIWRWRTAVGQFWRGYNIYQLPGQKWVNLRQDWNGHKAGEKIAMPPAGADKLIDGGLADETKNDRSHAPLPAGAAGGVAGASGGLHPNTPFTVMFLTPLALLPVGAMTVVMNLLKLAIVIASILMAAAVCNHDGKKMPDWVVLLGLLWAAIFIIADIQHGNTNTFVLGTLVGHLWLYRKGRDGWAGAGLALAICIKMMPAIFLLYWLYQRSWKVLASTIIWLIVMLVVLPAAAMAVREMADPAKTDAHTRAESHALDNAKDGLVHYRELMVTWYRNLIEPGLVKAEPYPIHINQSLPATLCRYLLKGAPGGDIFWNTDDYPNYNDYLRETKEGPGWIAVASLDESIVKRITRICQVAMVCLMGWAIGWRRLPRDDGRRGLHYGMVVAAMLIFNQRTWEEHAGAMLVATTAVFYAIAFGRVGKRVRAVTLVMALVVGPLLWLSGTEAFRAAAFFAMPHEPRKIIAQTGKLWADWAHAYGIGFACFLLIFACCVILARALKNQPQPYADTRQKLGE